MTEDATHQTLLWIAKNFHSSKDPLEEVAVAPSDTPLGDGLTTRLYTANLHEGYLQYFPMPTQKHEHLSRAYRPQKPLAFINRTDS